MGSFGLLRGLSFFIHIPAVPGGKYISQKNLLENLAFLMKLNLHIPYASRSYLHMDSA